MRLLTKLTLFNALSKLAIVALFVVLLPVLVHQIASRFTNYSLQEQKTKVLSVIQKNGIDYYLRGEPNYGSYTMLKDEYISLVESGEPLPHDTIETSRRLVENDTLTYRVLIHAFDYGKKRYTLEIGKTTASIDEYNRSLQRFALYVLIGLIAITLVTDLLFISYLTKPLGVIIKTKLLNRKFPFKDNPEPIRTSTSDFKYLDQSLIGLMARIRLAFEKEREFTSNASHELMTPISILQSKMENLMISPDLDDELQVSITGMMKTLNRLKRIVHSLLFISRIENDQFGKTDTINLAVLLREIQDELESRIEAKSLVFQMSVPDKQFLGGLNRDLIFQLLFNLINNAIRYNKEGGRISITGRLIPGKSYSLSIEDSGIGIPADELSTIFDRFKRNARAENEGYGLGLYIVKTISQFHDIPIDVQSEIDKGSIFTLHFPWQYLL